MQEKQRLLTPGAIYFWATVLFLYLPILLLVLFSLNDSVLLAFPLKGLTLHWYQELLEAGEMLQAAQNSLVVGVISSLIATAIGTMAAIAVTRLNFPGRDVFLSIAAVPMITPSIVLGVALLILFRQTINLPLSLGLITLSHVVISIPTTMLIVMARLAGFSKNLEEAAMDLGANYWVTLWRVILPLSLPALIAAFLTAFTASFDEYAMTTLITGTDVTLPVYLYSLLRFPRRLPVALSMGSVIIVASAILIVVAEWLRRVDFRGGAKEETA